MISWYPKPAAPGFGKDQLVPEPNASLFSRLFFSWLSPLLYVGYTRPLEADDLWSLSEKHHSSNLANRIERSFYARCSPEKRPSHLRSLPNFRSDESLFKALQRTFFLRWWTVGFLMLAADTLRTTTPLVTKVLLTWLVECYVYHRAPAAIPPPRGIGFGVGLAFALFAMQESASLLENHQTHLAMTLGMNIRSGVTAMITRKSLRLSPSSLATHSAGQVNTMISSDAARLEQFMTYVHSIWVSPIQIIIGIALLIHTLGYSALAGLGVIIVSLPVQGIFIFLMFTARKKGLKLTDQRVRGVREILNAVRLVKLYAWEEFYMHKVFELREKEVKAIRRIMSAFAGLIANMFFIPILCATLSFITYALTGHTLDVATIFTAFQFFTVLQGPLVVLPFVLNGLSDAIVALNRIVKFLLAEELDEQEGSVERTGSITINGDFVWIPTQSSAEGDKEKKNGATKGSLWRREKGERKSSISSTSQEGKIDPQEEERPFGLHNLDLSIPPGSFVAIVGTIGSGKSSVLQAMIGDMKCTRGSVQLGSEVAYVPQSAWIRNATVKENITFGQAQDKDRLSTVIRACALEQDLSSFPAGVETEIGERGINLSGGQKARISLARAAYSNASIVLLDDPLSAVDAHVGEHIVAHCILEGPLAIGESGQKRTRVLATHALGVTNKADRIYVMDLGKVVEQGTFQELMSKESIFARLMREHGSNEKSRGDSQKATLRESEEPGADEKSDKGLMQEEERNLGAVSWSTYARYLRYAGGLIWAPWIILLLVLTQGAQVSNSIFLGLWTSRSIEGFTQGQYMAVYAGIGGSQAVLTYILSYSFSIVGLAASLSIFKDAFKAMMRSPVSFFDTTPIGRILSRLSKDQDTLDSRLSLVAYGFLSTFMGMLGTVALVFYTFPYLGIIFFPLGVMYYLVSIFYRRTSIEVKRLDSVLRSALYASFNETLTGLSTIRSYKLQETSTKDAAAKLDVENRAWYMTIVVQRWLSVRLQLFGNLVVLGIGLFAAGFRNTIDPSKVGVVLSYTLGFTQILTEMVSQFANTEQNMNAVERILVYTDLSPEAALTSPNDPPPTWPEHGGITFKDVELIYRPGLPSVLKGVNFVVLPGEKIGIVGRTGAGKSSLLQALYRIVELSAGSIRIDDVEITNIGLDTLRSRLALVPQDSTLFFGTLRDNIDPLRTRTDAELITVLQRAWLLPSNGTSPSTSTEAKFSLDSVVGDDGSNYSAGEKQLLALARALVKDSRIIVLDEATSSVDVETDAKIQRTIRKEFGQKTLLCIAHRLNTILYYDRVLVMNDGKVAEFDTVLNLFENEHSLFRALCNEAGVSREDIVRIRAQG